MTQASTATLVDEGMSTKGGKLLCATHCCSKGKSPSNVQCSVAPDKIVLLCDGRRVEEKTNEVPAQNAAEERRRTNVRKFELKVWPLKIQKGTRVLERLSWAT